jgi:hypothetical protein
MVSQSHQTVETHLWLAQPVVAFGTSTRNVMFLSIFSDQTKSVEVRKNKPHFLKIGQV